MAEIQHYNVMCVYEHFLERFLNVLKIYIYIRASILKRKETILCTAIATWFQLAGCYPKQKTIIRIPI